MSGVLFSSRSARHRDKRSLWKRIFERLRDEHGFAGGYTTVAEYVREQKHRGQEVLSRLNIRRDQPAFNSVELHADKLIAF